MDDLEKTIRAVFGDVWKAQIGSDTPTLQANDVLLDSGLDSLGFAILVSSLEEELKYDPFTLSEDAFYPQTFAEFVDFYRKHLPSE